MWTVINVGGVWHIGTSPLILIEFGVPMKLLSLIKMCREVRIGKHLSESFPIQKGLKQGML
jgi:hypothetical protein